ncbi:MAG: recombination mediator RecR [Candidatus Nealsonbacteria bacterium]|nr:recombination mediator RecR [Candidatus Nealsonbacteria bacterium]
MTLRPRSIQKLIEIFSKFPTIGPRTADRFSTYIINLSDEEINDLVKSIEDVRKKIKTCSFCFNHFEISSEEDSLCGICLNPSRNRKILCIVEKENDLLSIEQTKKYKGLYFILGGTLSPLKKAIVKKIRTQELNQTLKDSPFEEVIIATNFTPEGETTALYLERLIKPHKIKTTRLARGLPTGGELEYIDDETLGSALEGRK